MTRRCQGDGRFLVGKVLGFCIDRRFFREVVLHGFGKADEITTLEPMPIRVRREI